MADPGREPVVGVVAREVEAGRAAVAAGRARPQRAQERPQPDVRDAVVCEPQHPQAPVGGEAAGQRLDAPPHVLDAGDPPFSFFLLLSAALALVAYAVGWKPG